MNKLKFIYVLLCFLHVEISFAQSEIVFNWTDKTDQINISSFNNAVYFTDYNGLPSFQKISKIENNIVNQIELYDLETIDVTDYEAKLLKLMSVSDDFEISSEVLKSRKEYYSRMLIFPYVKIDNTYKKIKSCKYKYIDKTSILKNGKKLPKLNSVLSQGEWYLLSVQKDGVYSLTYDDLIDLGVNSSQININSIRIYGNGGGMLPRLNSDVRDEDLVENAIQVVDNNNNGFFDNNDLILFYAEDVNEWKRDQDVIGKYKHFKHLYDDKNYYFLTFNMNTSSKRIGTYIPNLSGNTYISDVFNDHVFHELDLSNFIQSGEQWFGEIFDAEIEQIIPFSFPNIDQNSEIHLRSSVAARASLPSSFSFFHNNIEIMTSNLNSITFSSETDYASVSTNSSVFQSNSDVLDINVRYNRQSSSHKGWLDYIELSGIRQLIMNGNQMNVRKTINSLEDHRCSLVVKNISNSHRVWNITDPFNIKEHELENYSATEYSFDYDLFSGISDEKFILFDNVNFLSPQLEGQIQNQNLHAASNFDMLIVSHPDFLSAANLLADFHSQNSGRSCYIVTPQQIYNEFSSGKQDISAIRDYCRYLYNINTKFKYLLIIGDASYDPKDRLQLNTNFVITYQSNNSISPLNTFATDDYFGYLDDNEGLLENDLLDIGIGRLPAKSLDEANNMVRKIINYHNADSRGDWRNVMTFIADDGDDSDGNIHMSQAESLSNIINDNYHLYNLEKIYLDAYDQEATPVGQRSPKTNEAINRQIEKGSLIVNYTGHGGELGLTQERIVNVTQIQNWDNDNKLPLFVTATCEFGRFDNPALTSSGEYIILNPNGGGVALLTTTRYVYSHLNYNLNTNFINTIFEKVNGNTQTLGDVFLETKILSGTSINNNKFTLLGDPMMTLSIPKYKILTTDFSDTISALGKAVFSGMVVDSQDSTLVNNFNGIVYIKVFDKEVVSETQGQESSTPMSFIEQKNIIYQGKASVNSGLFSFSFIVPKDIDYTIGNGRISYYAIENNENSDASGWYESFIVGGISDEIIDDDLGPSVRLYMNSEDFISGGVTNSSPIFLAHIQDSSGINTVGNGIGHDITITIDGETSQNIILNEYYEADVDSYQSGQVEYPLSNISEGIHTIDFKVWDVFNNSSESSISFLVSSSEEFIINHLLNYPNPFTTNTSFYFEHNRPNNYLDIQIQIFTVSGQLIKTINRTILDPGFRVGPIYWDGKDDFQENIGRGTYVYKLKVKDDSGKIVQKLEKLVILR